MTATFRSRASRRKDQQIHEALVSGLSTAQVAAKFNLAVEQVAAADARVIQKRDKLDEIEADVEIQRTALRALFRMSIDGFRESGVALQESTRVSTDTAKPGHKARRTTKKKLADPRYLRIAIIALTQERSLLRLDDRPTISAASLKAGREVIDMNVRLMKEYPQIYDDYHHAISEIHAGTKLPKFDLNDPRFDPPKPDDAPFEWGDPDEGENA